MNEHAPSEDVRKGLGLGDAIIKADSKTGSTHMTDRKQWGELMAERLWQLLSSALQAERERCAEIVQHYCGFGPAAIEAVCAIRALSQAGGGSHEGR